MSLAAAAKPAAFRSDGRVRRFRATADGLVWTAAAVAGRTLVKPEGAPAQGAQRDLSPPPPPAALRKAYLSAFEKDVRDVAAGLYVAADDTATPDLRKLWRSLNDLFADGREVEARRQRRGGGVEVRETGEGEGLPPYYRQNFHFQTDGWLSAESARRYEAQVEALFAGSAGPMRRRVLALLARALKGVDQRALTLVDVACGSGSFLADLRATFPRAHRIGVDLSAAYLVETARRSGAETVEAAAERLPFADGSLQAVTCIYLFHELPPKVRLQVAAEIARVLAPGGVFAFGDSIQTVDAPALARPLESFPVNFHEPFYDSYQAADLKALFEGAGLVLEDQDTAFFTKAMLFRKPA